MSFKNDFYGESYCGNQCEGGYNEDERGLANVDVCQQEKIEQQLLQETKNV